MLQSKTEDLEQYLMERCHDALDEMKSQLEANFESSYSDRVLARSLTVCVLYRLTDTLRPEGHYIRDSYGFPVDPLYGYQYSIPNLFKDQNEIGFRRFQKLRQLRLWESRMLGLMLLDFIFMQAVIDVDEQTIDLNFTDEEQAKTLGYLVDRISNETRENFNFYPSK